MIKRRHACIFQTIYVREKSIMWADGNLFMEMKSVCKISVWGLYKQEKGSTATLWW